MTNASLTPSEALRRTTAALTAAGVVSAPAVARTLVAHGLAVPMSRLLLAPALTADQDATLAHLTAQIIAGTPVQHVTGVVGFRTVTVRVGPGVFIPRPETEVLAGWAVAQVQPHVSRVVELCAGSGAMAKAIITEAEPGEVWAVELAESALTYVRDNLAGTGAHVVAADMATACRELDGTVDLVVANPPYLNRADAARLPRDLMADPPTALFADDQGLAALRVVAATARRLLRPGGRVGTEHGDDQSEAVTTLLAAVGFTDIVAHPDLTGRQRFVTAVLPKQVLCDDGGVSSAPQRMSLDDPGVGAAVREVIAVGGCVVLPTDTVYGIGTDPFSAAAVQRLQDAKGRGDQFPPPVLVADTDAAKALVGAFPAEAQRLAERLWPGPLTLVLPAARRDVSLAAAVSTVGVRVPALDGLCALLATCGPLAVSSANRHGQAPATTVDQAMAQLGDRVDLYVDGGPTPGAQPSTVVDLSGGTVDVLREGLISRAAIAAIAEGRDA